MDSWDGYGDSQDRVIDFLDAQGPQKNPVVLTGDVHASWANEILSDFDDPSSRPVGVEFVGTSITSGGDGSDIRADTAQVLAENPHIKFFNNYRGYVRCSLTPEEWRADYRVLACVKQPGSPVTTRASFVVENGKPRLQPADASPVANAARISSETEASRLDAQEEAAEKGERKRRRR